MIIYRCICVCGHPIYLPRQVPIGLKDLEEGSTDQWTSRNVDLVNSFSFPTFFLSWVDRVNILFSPPSQFPPPPTCPPPLFVSSLPPSYPSFFFLFSSTSPPYSHLNVDVRAYVHRSPSSCQTPLPSYHGRTSDPISQFHIDRTCIQLVCTVKVRR